MADELIPGLTPLQITPQMMNTAQPPPQSNDGGGVDSLKAMFPDLDKDVLATILADMGGNVESAIETLLEMTGQATQRPMGGGGGGGGGGGDGRQITAADYGDPSGFIDEDEELAKSMFLQFASELERELKVKVPDEVRADPELYQAFMAVALEEHEQAAAQQQARGSGGSSGGGAATQTPAVDGLAARVFNNSEGGARAAKSGGGGVAAFLDRFRGKAKATPMMSSTRVRVIAVGDDRNKESMSASLLNNQGGV